MTTVLTQLSDAELQAIVDASHQANPHRFTAGSVMSAIGVGLAADLELSRRAIARLKLRELAQRVLDQHDPGDEDIDAWAERLGADVAQADE